MAYNFVDWVIYHGKKPNFERDAFETKAAMKAFNENWLPDVFMAICYEDHQIYLFDRSNDVDPETGRWRVFSGGGDSKLTAAMTANSPIGFIAEGKKFDAGTNIEDVLRTLIEGESLAEDDFYYGAFDSRDIVSLYQFTGSTSAVCTIAANNQYVAFATKEDKGEIEIRDNNGFGYNSDFDKTSIVHNGINYNVYIGKYRITTTGFNYKLSFKE